eukprot:scaffold7615_cov286-Pinguiococcus_pyrenoidosus.AAC.13
MKFTLVLLALAALATQTLAFRSAFVAAPVSSASSARMTTRGNLVMRARNCDLTGKRPNRDAMVVTFSHKRNKTVQYVNLQNRRFWWEEGSRYVRMRVSTKAIKTIKKYGLEESAKKYGVDLSKF